MVRAGNANFGLQMLFRVLKLGVYQGKWKDKWLMDGAEKSPCCGNIEESL